MNLGAFDRQGDEGGRDVSVIELDLDDRRRVPLTKLVSPDVRRLRATRLENGSIMLTPVHSLTDDELAMLQNPERMASIKRGVEQAKRGEVTSHTAEDLRAAYIEEYGIAPEEDR